MIYHLMWLPTNFISIPSVFKDLFDIITVIQELKESDKTIWVFLFIWKGIEFTRML